MAYALGLACVGMYMRECRTLYSEWKDVCKFSTYIKNSPVLQTYSKRYYSDNNGHPGVRKSPRACRKMKKRMDNASQLFFAGVVMVIPLVLGFAIMCL